MGVVNDITGQVFGRLKVISRSANDPSGRAKWLCTCTCGNTTTVLGGSLRDGNTKSCGCLHKDSAASIGHLNRTHGFAGTRFYKIWKGIKERCNNPNNEAFKNYGAFNIKVCDEWEDSFENFARDMFEEYDDTLTLERIDINKGYSKENCKWIPLPAQARNKSLQRNNTSGVVGVSNRGDKYWVAQWRPLSGKAQVRLYSILKYGDELARFLAEERRDLEIRKLNLQGADYSPNHGKPRKEATQ